MKYEEIKIGDVFRFDGDKEAVISKSDEYKIITTIDDDMISSSWEENQLHLLKPIKEETTLELVSKAYLDLSKFRIEIEQEGNMLVINPIKK